MRKAYAAIILAVFSLSGAPQVFSQPSVSDPAAHVVLQGSDFYRMRVGSASVIALSDGTVPQDLYVLLTNTNSAKTDAQLKEGFLSNPVEASINAFLIKFDQRLVG